MVATINKTITLYGKRNSITANLKYNLEKQIIKRGQDIDLIEVDDPAAFINEDIRHLPCIVVNNTKYYYYQTDDLKTFITKIIHETMPNSNRNFVNQIIVPVDFSDYSRNSFYQAFKLARKLNANITMVHVYAPVVVPAEGVLYIDPDLQKDVNARFNQFVDELEKSLTDTDRTSVKIDREFRVGMVTNELQEMVKTVPGSMLVLSTSGTGQKIKEILGSISLWVVKHAQCPILLIPPDVHELNFERILFASDHFGMYDDAISAIRYYSVSPEATIDVVHVFEEGSKYMQRDTEILRERSDKQIREVILFDDDFPGTIQKYLKTHAIDLLVMERKDRGFWKELFHTSMTRKMAVYSEVPILILHEDQIVQFR